jgi:hypothetical protein
MIPDEEQPKRKMEIFEIGVYAIEAENSSGDRLRHDCVSNVVEISRLMNGSYTCIL